MILCVCRWSILCGSCADIYDVGREDAVLDLAMRIMTIEEDEGEDVRKEWTAGDHTL
jgi:hypothetical protein